MIELAEKSLSLTRKWLDKSFHADYILGSMYKQTKTISQKEIARIVGVSQRAVASVVGTGNSNVGVGEATKKRIIEVAYELGYRPNRGAQLLRGVPSGLIGLVKTVSLGEAQPMMSLYLGEILSDMGYQMISVDILWKKMGLSHALEFLYDNSVEGLLVFESNAEVTSSKCFRRFQDAGIPTVLLAPPSKQPPKGVHCICGDLYQGTSLIVHHLLDQGYRRVAMVVADRLARTFSRQRVRAYEQIMKAEGLGIDIVLVPFEDRGPGVEEAFDVGRRGMETLLARDQLPEAAIFTNDQAAFAAMNCCQRHGVNVPEDLALSGCDDHTLGRYCLPTLTSVGQPIRDIAIASAQRIIDLIRGKRIPDDQHVQELPCSLRARASTGGAAPQKPMNVVHHTPFANNTHDELLAHKQ